MIIPCVAIVTVSRDFPYGFCQNTKHQIILESHIPTSILEQLVARVVAQLQELIARVVAQLQELVARVVAQLQEPVAWLLAQHQEPVA